MIYTEKDIDFKQITPTEFENLCYELIVSYGFQSATWRQGGADSGRDIEAKQQFNSTFTTGHYTKWFFECKHYTGGVPPEELNSKIAWADAENPDFLVILTTSYISNSAKVWLDKIRTQKRYKIIVVEGEEIKSRLTSFQNLIPKYFSADKYIKLYQEIRRHNLIYNINASFEALKAIIENIPPDKFELNDIGFLLNTFYSQYRQMEHADEFSGFFDEKLPYRLFDRLKELTTQEDLKPFLNDFDYLAGDGFMDETELETENNLVYQDHVLHLNVMERDKWELGYYLLVVIDKKSAFELFIYPNRDYETHSFIYPEFNENILHKILVKFHGEGHDLHLEIKKYSKGIF